MVNEESKSKILSLESSVQTLNAELEGKALEIKNLQVQLSEKQTEVEKVQNAIARTSSAMESGAEEACQVTNRIEELQKELKTTVEARGMLSKLDIHMINWIILIALCRKIETREVFN